MKIRHQHRHTGQAQQMTEGGGAPLSGGRRTIDFVDRQSLQEELIGRTSAFITARGQTACLIEACESRLGTAHAGALGCGLGLVIAVASCGGNQRRKERQHDQNESEGFPEKLHDA